jgi:Pyridine nucleotide-disulphide oxidoreductase
VFTYEEQIMSHALPSSIASIGARPIGIEFAYVLGNYGVAVTMRESLQRVQPNEDVDVSKEIAKAYRNLGVTMLIGARIEGLTESADADTLTVDVVVQAIGFAPNTKGYGLERLGVASMFPRPRPALMPLRVVATSRCQIPLPRQRKRPRLHRTDGVRQGHRRPRAWGAARRAPGRGRRRRAAARAHAGPTLGSDR